ncbi:hypothetical protein BDN72DRAFT_619891 [Pluteus cervinus]|uniref:Uncharacterized protein n=1 Tax=Pluteus cervinus TaxID=181527 RepID=A0ACD3AVM4_9AGAR|nr:hypothetical protein BDN72DRAFT_619891 [Pluteus cervinus]
MPHLQELTRDVPGPQWHEPTAVDPPFITLPSQSISSDQGRFPALERLYLTGSITPITKQVIETHCPNLLYFRTFLKVSSFLQELEDKIIIYQNRGDQAPTPMSIDTPSSVIQHLLDINCRNDIDILRSTLVRHGLDIENLRELVDSRVKMCVYVYKIWRTMEREWEDIDRVTGGKGGWNWECVC